MPICPYCKEDLETKLEVKPTSIDDTYKDLNILKAYESFIDIQAEVAPFGGNLMKKMAKLALKFVDRYLDQVGAIPMVLHSCSKCDSLLSSESLFDLMGGLNSKK